MAQLEADLLIVGGGINGCGIARDAAGRGLRVVLVEQADLASGTSSASSKLIHGGLRYLEQLEFRLVREALAEREVLLRAAPHLVHALRFVMPHAVGLRPPWMIRAGLLLYDWLARRDALASSKSVSFEAGALGDVLKPFYKHGYTYSDCQVDDARLVIANAVAAAELGARIFTRTRCAAVERQRNGWHASLESTTGQTVDVEARVLVNAAGAAARQFLTRVAGISSGPALKLVQGSHIVVPRISASGDAFILQNDDGRVVFVCPFEEQTLIGTTDVALTGDASTIAVSADEIDYLCKVVNRYFTREIASSDVLWSYCGVRPLVDDGDANPSHVTRDYVLHVDSGDAAAPVLTVFGGKLTTYRKLAERALEKMAPWLPTMGRAWTTDALLPGGDLPERSVDRHVDALAVSYPRLPPRLLRSLALRHGTRARDVLKDAAKLEELGESFGAGLYARELEYMIDREWARNGDDVVWRRTKAGLQLTRDQRTRIEEYITRHAGSL